MENFYLFFIVVLFILAISDLVIGVSNDAVNFLNSAIGSKAAPFKWVMFVAALGVLIGATFSGGMMEIARSGIFHPDKFYFSEIILIFLAVMITDVLLLDAFNTIGLPTSTTVSIVFELLGASLAIAVMKISNGAEPQDIGQYINSGKALAIVSGILLSVVIAFTVGAFVQWLTRLLFSFDYEKRLRYLGGLFGGLALTAIVYFILIKGAKDAAFMTRDAYAWIKAHQGLIMLVSFGGFTLFFYVFNLLFKLNILKVVVLTGTFALAMAFAGNDLVNFIGVPLAGLESYKTLLANPGADPDFFPMGALRQAIQTPPLFLLAAGIIMVVTFYTSRKARAVIQTSVDLSRQHEGEERFGSTPLSRSVVRLSLNVSAAISKMVPERIKKASARSFELPARQSDDPNPPAFDLLRAAINLVVSSALIAFGTSLKLPLSTTYVTFMVAMGTSLADGAWDRDSAVYRITGVFSVIGGWFLTAFSAFFSAFLLATLFWFGDIYAIVAMTLLAAFIVFRTHKHHLQQKQDAQEGKNAVDKLNTENIVSTTSQNMAELLEQTRHELKRLTKGLAEQQLKTLKKSLNQVELMSGITKERKNNITLVISKLRDDTLESGHFYVQTLDYAREITHCLNHIVKPVFDHLNNHHKPFNQNQLSDLKQLVQSEGIFLSAIAEKILQNDFSQQETLANAQQKLLSQIDLVRKNEVKRMKKENVSSRNTLLLMGILQELKNLSLFAFNLYKSQRDFSRHHQTKDGAN